jgi:hypothetical protein
LRASALSALFALFAALRTAGFARVSGLADVVGRAVPDLRFAVDLPRVVAAPGVFVDEVFARATAVLAAVLRVAFVAPTGLDAAAERLPDGTVLDGAVPRFFAAVTVEFLRAMDDFSVQ